MKTIYPRLNPLNDFLFFKVLGEKGDEEQLIGFLNAVMKRGREDSVVSAEIQERKNVSAEVIEDKTSILDIRAVLADGALVNIEVRLRNLRDMDKRSLCYWNLEYGRSLEAGHYELPNVVAINIVNYEFMKRGGYHMTFHVREDRERDVLLTEALEIHFVDMVKYRRIKEKDVRGEPLERWLAWFDRESPKELIEEVVEMDGAIRKAEERLRYVGQDKEALRAYEMRELALSDYTSGLNYARWEGLQEGLQKGRRAGEREIAKRLKDLGETSKRIALVTGLSVDEIARL